MSSFHFVEKSFCLNILITPDAIIRNIARTNAVASANASRVIIGSKKSGGNTFTPTLCDGVVTVAAIDLDDNVRKLHPVRMNDFTTFRYAFFLLCGRLITSFKSISLGKNS